MDASPVNRREAGVVDWLIERLGVRLADRDGGRHAPPWEPKQNVLLGVLEPTRMLTPPVQEDGEPADEATAVEVTEPVPSTADVPAIGLDFRIHTDPDATTITLDVDVCYAIYLEEIASLEEQRQYIGTESDNASVDAVETGEVSISPDYESNATPAEDALTPASGAPKGDGASAAVEEVAPKRKRAKKARLLGAWHRQDIAPSTVQIHVPLDGSVAAVGDPLMGPASGIIDDHYASPNAVRPFTTRRNELPREALVDEAAFRAAVAAALDAGWVPSYPELALTAFAQPLGGGDYLISLALRNVSMIRERTQQDLAIYDTRLSVHPGPETAIVPQRFDLAPDDYRMSDLADVIGRGNACVAVGTDRGGVRTETLPTHVEQVVEPRADHVRPLTWVALSQNPAPVLASVQVAMEDYQRDFQAFVNDALGQPHNREAAKGLEQFSDELRRFKLGREAMRRDPKLARSFQLANEVFARANEGKSFDSWRLFQFVYIVSHLPSLAARDHVDPELRRELDYVDVLWFPAGGGKTEAYLGLIITALFYDRLRGKDAGVTAWLRFPLRMLSVQQLFRMLRVLVFAEDLRREQSIGAQDGDPFALGYLVGGQGTPNRLQYNAGWWKGWEAETRRHCKGTFTEDHLADRLITRCPYCERECVVLSLDVDNVRLLHRCTECERDLPLYISDDEVFRYLPSVVISTVDKLTGYTWFGEFTAFSRGPANRCAKHGYFSFPNQGTCAVGPDLCKPPKGGHPVSAPIKDPVPALTVQDEMHLLKEELGAFSGHYEGLIAELQRRGPSGLPTKILAASATIEQFEDQLRQVYGRLPRAFPSAGWERTSSFYTRETHNVRRTFVGILPHYRRKADVAAIVQTELIRVMSELQDEDDPLAALGIDPGLWDAPPSQQQVLDLLFDYEVSLTYVNSKANGAKIDEELRLLSDQLVDEGRGPVERVVLTGQVPIPDLADAISRVQNETRALDRSQRLRALVGTSVVSHGVDLDRLNALVMAGMPTTAADYIQVTARSGRSHAGLVVTVYDSSSRRERSLFSNFASYHLFLDQMVTPVPVNKYAYFVADRTVPGIALALLHDLARDPLLGAPANGIRRSRDFQPWWNANRSAIDACIRDRLRSCYETPIPGVNDPGMERELGDRAMRRWVDTESRSLSIPAQEPLTKGMFHSEPLSNFRDIDEPADFQVWYPNKDAFLAVTGQLPDGVDDSDDSEGE